MATRNLLALLIAALLISYCTAAKAELTVTATIRPLHFIALAIIGDRGEVNSPIGSNSSPHHFNLSPGNRVDLVKADIVVWIGPELESHVSDSIRTASAPSKLLTVSEISSLTTHNIGSQQLDAHLWLDTRNAFEIAKAIAEKAIQLDPGLSEYYSNNLIDFEAALDRVEKEIKQKLAGSDDKPFMVYHNGFQYFEKQFGLSHRLDLVKDPEVAPGINDIIRVRAEISTTRPVCLLREPDANPQLIRTFVENYEFKESMAEASIDLLGNNIVENPAAYIELITHVANGFSTCLNGGSKSGSTTGK